MQEEKNLSARVAGRSRQGGAAGARLRQDSRADLPKRCQRLRPGAGVGDEELRFGGTEAEAVQHARDLRAFAVDRDDDGDHGSRRPRC